MGGKDRKGRNIGGDTRPALPRRVSTGHRTCLRPHKWRRGAVTQGFPNEATRASGRAVPGQTCARFGCPLRPAATLRCAGRPLKKICERVVVAHDTGGRSTENVHTSGSPTAMPRKMGARHAGRGVTCPLWSARLWQRPLWRPFGVVCSHHIFRPPVSNDQFALACIQTPG